MTGALRAADAKALLHGRAEVALLDIREHGQYGEGHPFMAVPCPYSRLEMTIAGLVPRLGAPVILFDDGDGIAERAAAILGDMGYRDMSWIEGGAEAWRAAGFTLFKGVNLPSKTLGELLEEAWRVPHIGVDTLARWQVEGRPHHLFDGRPISEHRKMTIPGARSMPNGELPHRLPTVVTDGEAPIVIHCAGRTRSIIGAAGLALAGITNPVFALENGTQGWALSGRALKFDAEPPPRSELDETARAVSGQRARRLIASRRLETIDLDGLRRLAKDRYRTLYVYDVRTAEEFAAGSLKGAIHAPAVQLVQATDHWIGLRRARVVLGDDTGLRAAITATFLRMLGYDVFVLPGIDQLADASFIRADSATTPEIPLTAVVGASEAGALVKTGAATLVDLRPSMDFRNSHLEGARWSSRPRLVGLALDRSQSVLLAGSDADVAGVLGDLAAAGFSDVRRVTGGAPEWRAAGVPVVATASEPTDGEAIDFLFFVHDRHDGNLDSARRYLAWEQGLVAQLDDQERAEYHIGPGPFAG